MFSLDLVPLHLALSRWIVLGVWCSAGFWVLQSMSLLNHDCQPNCVMMFEGKTLYLRAITDIQPQEELTISYTDAVAPSEERRRQLEEQYHFHCQCQRCSTADKLGSSVVILLELLV
ncbi:hypothetical protein AALO_G00242160 [Alosa alosa]|uniref:[histone H3]-lysine(4) N-trimethyltransferase n=1 Tax=Alosa alosa TaxID=278164 RepID=A0AAV6FRK3_9TELE|nr:hypothetical protein AALO_G00242160 [Alosa alosa]